MQSPSPTRLASGWARSGSRLQGCHLPGANLVVGDRAERRAAQDGDVPLHTHGEARTDREPPVLSHCALLSTREHDLLKLMHGGDDCVPDPQGANPDDAYGYALEGAPRHGRVGTRTWPIQPLTGLGIFGKDHGVGPARESRQIVRLDNTEVPRLRVTVGRQLRLRGLGAEVILLPVGDVVVEVPSPTA